MSTNIGIFEYSNKMGLEYYLYLHSCHFPSTNIFAYSFVDFWTTEYVQIFVCKFLEIRIYLNIYSEPYFIICLSIFNKKVYLVLVYASQNIQCRILFSRSMSEPFKKNSSITDKYKYSNIQIKWPSNTICIPIRAISGVRIYSDIRSLNMLQSNIFRYSFGTYCGIQIYYILWYSLITVVRGVKRFKEIIHIFQKKIYLYIMKYR